MQIIKGTFSSGHKSYDGELGQTCIGWSRSNFTDLVDFDYIVCFTKTKRTTFQFLYGVACIVLRKQVAVESLVINGKSNESFEGDHGDERGDMMWKIYCFAMNCYYPAGHCLVFSKDC